MNRITVKDLIIKSAPQVTILQKGDGSFPPGHNGPWKNIDTPVRVTAHWIIFLLKAFEITGDDIYRKSAIKACKYLESKKLREGFSYYCCKSFNDVIKCNGLIGQAWAIEALIKISEDFKTKHPLEIAEDILLKHPFNERLSIWHCLGFNGQKLPEHTTFNQQVWFFLMSYRTAKLTNNKELDRRNQKFLNSLPALIKFDGRYIDMLINEKIFLKNAMPQQFANILLNRIRKKMKLVSLSEGYLSFTLCGLAQLYKLAPEINLWKDDNLRQKIQKSVSFMETYLFDKPNDYAFTYNPSGIEMAFVGQTFKNLIKIRTAPEKWLSEQVKRHYDFNAAKMSIDTTDVATFSARLYEITYIAENTSIRVNTISCDV